MCVCRRACVCACACGRVGVCAVAQAVQLRRAARRAAQAVPLLHRGQQRIPLPSARSSGSTQTGPRSERGPARLKRAQLVRSRTRCTAARASRCRRSPRRGPGCCADALAATCQRLERISLLGWRVALLVAIVSRFSARRLCRETLTILGMNLAFSRLSLVIIDRFCALLACAALRILFSRPSPRHMLYLFAA
eukprot:2048400-Pleurochrysis_carterae.AAC.2